MNLLRYKKVEMYEFRKILDKYIGLTEYQKEKLLGIDWFPFTVIRYEKPEPVKPLWRLTILFYWLFLLVMLALVIPVKWLFTGKSYFSEKNWTYRVYAFWTKKLGLS